MQYIAYQSANTQSKRNMSSFNAHHPETPSFTSARQHGQKGSYKSKESNGKWCSKHQVPGHSDSECRLQNGNSNGPSNKKTLLLHSDGNATTLRGKLDNKVIGICLDSGASFCFIHESTTNKLTKEALGA